MKVMGLVAVGLGLLGMFLPPAPHHAFPVAGRGIVLPQFPTALCLAPGASHPRTVYPQLPRVQGHSPAYQGSLCVIGVDNPLVLCLWHEPSCMGKRTFPFACHSHQLAYPVVQDIEEVKRYDIPLLP